MSSVFLTPLANIRLTLFSSQQGPRAIQIMLYLLVPTLVLLKQ